MSSHIPSVRDDTLNVWLNLLSFIKENHSYRQTTTNQCHRTLVRDDIVQTLVSLFFVHRKNAIYCLMPVSRLNLHVGF